MTLAWSGGNALASRPRGPGFDLPDAHVSKVQLWANQNALILAWGRDPSPATLRILRKEKLQFMHMLYMLLTIKSATSLQLSYRKLHSRDVIHKHNIFLPNKMT